jgi:hypothetical protein
MAKNTFAESNVRTISVKSYIMPNRQRACR